MQRFSSKHYYGLLSDAIARLDPNTRESRREAYDRARELLKEQARAASPEAPGIAEEQQALEQAILDIEIRSLLGEPIWREAPIPPAIADSAHSGGDASSVPSWPARLAHRLRYATR